MPAAWWVVHSSCLCTHTFSINMWLHYVPTCKNGINMSDKSATRINGRTNFNLRDVLCLLFYFFRCPGRSLLAIFSFPENLSGNPLTQSLSTDERPLSSTTILLLCRAPLFIYSVVPHNHCGDLLFPRKSLCALIQSTIHRRTTFVEHHNSSTLSSTSIHLLRLAPPFIYSVVPHNQSCRQVS